MPLLIETEGKPNETVHGEAESQRKMRIRNRRKRYLELHEDYFSSPNLELAGSPPVYNLLTLYSDAWADPLLYDRLIRRFMSASEREADGRKKGYSGVLEADLLRSEAKLAALAHPDPESSTTYQRGVNGEIMPEKKGDIPATKEEGQEAWREHITWRFLRGDDDDTDYPAIDDSEEYDWLEEKRRDEEDQYFGQEEPSWRLENGSEVGHGDLVLQGETGVQDF